MGLPRRKVLKLKRAAYGLIDASRSFYLKQARELKSVGLRPLTFDPATFIMKEKQEDMMVAGTAVHVDDTLNVGKQEVIDALQKELNTKLTYGAVDKLPFRFLGINIRKEDNGNIVLDQQHYVDGLEVPDTTDINHLAKQDILPKDFQTTFRSLASKLNTLSGTCRPDFSFAAKYLTSRYGKATKSDLTQAIKLIRRAKSESTECLIPNIGKPEEWILVGVSDASNKTSNNVFAVGGHVVLLVNRVTQAASILHHTSKKLDRVVPDSTSAETISLQKCFSSLFFVRKLLEEMCGDSVKELKCLALTDSHNLYSNIHHLKNSADHKLLADIINIRQGVFDTKTVQEVRYCAGSGNISDCLTKTTKNGDMLMDIVRNGRYDVPGGFQIRDSSMLSIRTWHQLMRAEGEQVKPVQAELDKSDRTLCSPTVPERTLQRTNVKSPGKKN